MSSARPSPAERAIATAFFAPIGLGAKVVEDFPGAVDKARQQIVFARFIGKMAVDQGVRELRERLDGAAGSTADTEPAPTAPAVVPDSAPVEEPVSETASEPATVSAPDSEPVVVAADELALPDYDQLPAAHIVGKLEGLDAAELTAIEAYETAHRHRRTVLGKITQLMEA